MSMNVLTEKWLTGQCSNGTKKSYSLPEVFSALSRDEIRSFPALRPHQYHPFYAFLVQLACLALDEAEQFDALPAVDLEQPWLMAGSYDADQWRSMLRALTAKWPDDEPWCLVVDDPLKPAFFQAPLTDSLDKSLKPEMISHPDAMDLLVTSKNHDEKQFHMKAPSVEDWIFALISLQTNVGYSGAGNYGIARQNSGYASRIAARMGSTRALGGQWARDVRVIADHFDELWEHCFTGDGRYNLLWLEPWYRETILPLAQCHPLFIEISRPLRFSFENERLTVQLGTSDNARVDAGEFHGALNDPWTLLAQDPKGFIKSYGSGMSYKVISDPIMSARRPLLFRWHGAYDGMGSQVATFEGLMKRQGKTEGLARREIILPPDLKNSLKPGGDLSEVARIAKAMIDQAWTAENRVLKVALATVLHSRKATYEGTVNLVAGDVKEWIPATLKAMDDEVDQQFFPSLWEEVCRQQQADVGEMSDQWILTLRRLAGKYFERGLASLPELNGRSLKARTLGQLKLKSLMKSQLPLSQETQS